MLCEFICYFANVQGRMYIKTVLKIFLFLFFKLLLVTRQAKMSL